MDWWKPALLILFFAVALWVCLSWVYRIAG